MFASAMKSSKKTTKKERKKDFLQNYHDPEAPGSLGGVSCFARAQHLPVGKVRETVERDLGYSLHKPRRRRFPTLPVLVFNIDQQWVADLVEVQNISKYNKGMRYLLMVIDAFSKYAWVEPIKTKTGKAVTEAFEKILKRSQGRQPQNLQTDDGKEFCKETSKDTSATIYFKVEFQTESSLGSCFQKLSMVMWRVTHSVFKSLV